VTAYFPFKKTYDNLQAVYNSYLYFSIPIKEEQKIRISEKKCYGKTGTVEKNHNQEHHNVFFTMHPVK